MTLLASIVSFSQKITRGPEQGEIYFLGPTVTLLDQVIYRSTDFGESIICMDSLSQVNNLIEAISADKETGNIYFSTILEDLYHSGSYGQAGTWVHKSNNVYPYLLSGVNSGYVFEYCMKHSEDFGNSFINHSLNGYFGVVISSELDVQNGIGYTILKYWGKNDTLYFMKSNDNFENLELLNKFIESNEPLNWLSRGFSSGELFSFIENESSMIRFSNDYGYSWSTKNRLYLNNFFDIGFTGGRQPGELYLLVTYIQLAGQRKHIYIYHSLDYGETFTAYHPFSFGPDPFFIGFNAEPKSGIVPLTVEFYDESSGENLNYEWDFDNDGTYDSYEQNPAFVYLDTGNYSVKLKLISPTKTDSLIKYRYINIKDTITRIQYLNNQKPIVYPNPFNDKISIEAKTDFKMIEIYDLNGKSHFIKTLTQENKTEIIDLKNLEKGIYILKLKTEEQNITKKIIKI